MSERTKFKCDVCSAKCRVNMRLELEEQQPIPCMSDAFTPKWIKVGD